jgi:hypothetical protein
MVSNAILEKSYPKFTHQLVVGIIFYIILIMLVQGMFTDNKYIIFLSAIFIIDFGLLVYRFKNTSQPKPVEEPIMSDPIFSLSMQTEETVKPTSETSIKVSLS